MLADPAVADDIRKQVVVPDTGNDENDYVRVRDQVERLAQDREPPED